jgi:hypothetical protein
MRIAAMPAGLSAVPRAWRREAMMYFSLHAARIGMQSARRFAPTLTILLAQNPRFAPTLNPVGAFSLRRIIFNFRAMSRRGSQQEAHGKA